MKRILLVIMCAVSLSAVVSGAEMMTLDNYLQRVETDNPDIAAVNHSIEAVWQKVLELDMVYSPILSGSYNHSDDKSGPGLGSTLEADEIKSNVLNVNASKKFDTGTNVSIGYSYVNANIDMLPPLTFPFNGVNYTNFNAYTITPVLQVSQSLLRDFGAGLTQSGINKAKAAAAAGQYTLYYKKQQLLLGARSAYWNLALAREVLDFRASSLDRAQKLLDWNEKKNKLDLIEKSDLLQSQAAYKLRQLNSQLAKEDEVRACRSFNQMLGFGGDTVPNDLEKISDKVSAFSNIDKLSINGKRADVLAAESSYKSSELADRETKYRAMPELSLNGSYELNGLGLSYSDAWDQVETKDKPAYTIGLSFTVPLDFGTLSKVRRGYFNDFESAKGTFKSAQTAAQNDWDQLQLSWANVKSRLDLAKEIMKIQDDRVKNEQSKFERGRSTTFLLLSAENDLDDATLNVYRTVFEEIMTLAQAELYNTQPINNK